MIIKTGCPSLFHGCDILCLNFDELLMSMKRNHIQMSLLSIALERICTKKLFSPTDLY